MLSSNGGVGKAKKQTERNSVCDPEAAYSDVLVHHDSLSVPPVAVLDSVLAWTFGCSHHHPLVRVD